MDDIQLLENIHKDPGQFSGLFRLYYKPIFGYILRRTGNFDDTADIAADTFFNAFTHIKSFKYTGVSLKVWLYRIATNELNMYFRHQKRKNLIFGSSANENLEALKTYIAEDRKEVESELEKNEQFLYVLGELKKLPVKYQEVISLKYFEGKENKEIAEILNLKEGTLKSLLSRGIEKLRKTCNRNLL